MYSREGERRVRTQESTIFQRSLRSEGKDRSECKAESRRAKCQSGSNEDGSGSRSKDRSMVYTGDLPRTLASRYNGYPTQKSVFHGHEIKQLMDQILDKELSSLSYESTTCKALCLTLSEDIKQKVKDLLMSRYRIICHVSIGSCSGQGLLMASRFVWNDGKDNYVTATYRNVSLFAVATVFGVVKE